MCRTTLSSCALATGGFLLKVASHFYSFLPQANGSGFSPTRTHPPDARRRWLGLSFNARKGIPRLLSSPGSTTAILHPLSGNADSERASRRTFSQSTRRTLRRLL